jgi:hypothetical protein
VWVFLAVVLTPNSARETDQDLIDLDRGMNTELDAALSADPDNLKKALNEPHYRSCQSEMAGRAVAFRADAKPYDHCQEVSEYQQAAVNKITQLNGLLNDSRLFDTTKQFIEQRISSYSRLLDASEWFFSRGPSPVNPLSPYIPRGVPYL